MSSRIIALSVPPSFGPITNLIGHSKPGLNISVITDNEELKPCPFCGNKAVIVYCEISDYYSVICQDDECRCNARIPYCRTEEEAITAWNTRATNE